MIKALNSSRDHTVPMAAISKHRNPFTPLSDANP